MRIPEAQIDEITQRLDIADVVGDYVALRPRGNRLWGLCPFHEEKTASFAVSPDKGAFYCFGCGRGGGLIQFVMDVEQLTFPEAVQLLADRAGVALEQDRSGPPGAPSRREYLELNGRIAATFHHLLRTSDEAAAARSYLAGRQIDEQAIVDFKIGWAPAAHGWLLGFLRKKSYSDSFLAHSGLFVERSGGGRTELRALFWGRVMFPIATARGEVVGFGGRTLGEDGPKYVNSSETPFFHKQEHLFGLDHALPLLRDAAATAPQLEEHPAVAIVEGYTDVIALTKLGIPAVATLGTAFGAAHARLLRRHQLGALLMFDADEAGRNAALRSVLVLSEHDLPVAVVPLPQGVDPADMVCAGDQGELQKRLKSPITGAQYTIDTAIAGKDLNAAEGKEQAFRGVFPFLKGIESAIRRDALLHEVAAQLRLDYDTVSAEFTRLATGSGSRSRFAPAREAQQPAAAGGRGGSGAARAGQGGGAGEPATVREAGPPGAELRLLLAVAVNRDQFAQVRGRLAAEDLADPRARELYIAMEDSYRHEQTDTDSLLRRLETPGLRALVMEKLSVDEFALNAADYIDSGIRQVKKNALQRRREQLLDRVRSAQRAGETQTLSELLADKMFLDSELQKLEAVDS